MPNIIRVPGGGQTKIPSDLSPLCPNFVVKRNGTKVKISADKIQLNSYTDMVSGGVWAWGKTRPTKPTGENTKLWSRAELITTSKPYDGLYLGDVTPSDAVTETLIYLPENQSGSVKLVPFLVLSTDYLGGVYVMRKHTSKDFYGLVRNQNGSYFGGGADVWITNTYLNSVLGKDVSSALLDCEITTAGVKQTRKCWIPGMPEVGSNNYPGDGEKMSYFESDQRRIAYDEDTGTPHVSGYWTRTQASSTHNFSISSTGKATQTIVTNFTCYRPSFVLPKDFKIQRRPDGSYTVWNEQGLMTLGDVEPSNDVSNTILNGAEDLKAGGHDIASFIYAANGYIENDGALLVRNNILDDAKSSGAAYPSTNAGICAETYATVEASTANISRTLSNGIRAIVQSVTAKYYNGAIMTDFTAKGFILSVSDLAEGFDAVGNGTLLPCFKTASQRKAIQDKGTALAWWTRDSLNGSNSYIIDSAGNQTALTATSVQGVRPCIMLPLDTPIRALADGTYDLVPDDPAIGAQTVSTLADDEVPLEVEFDWPESDPLIARQWVYNEKGIYQTMLLGGVASTEDASYSEVLSENTWAQIAEAVANNDPIVDSWQIGDTKDELVAGETLTFVIVGKDHDDKSDGTGKAKLTFGMTQLMNNTRQMNGSNTNAGSFAGSALYAHLRDTILPGMPEELRAAIKPVNKPTSSGSQNSTIRNDSMSLWLFSEVEIFGRTTNSFGGEGFQYPYFATAANRIKRLFNGAGEVSIWWERSPFSGRSAYFCCVGTSGAAGGNGASNSFGVCFGFCI